MFEIDKITAWIAEAIAVVRYNLTALALLFLCVMLGSIFTVGLLAGPLMCGFLVVLFRLIEDKRKGVVTTPTHPKDLMKGFDYFTQSLLVCSIFIVVLVLRAAFYSITGYNLGIVWSLIYLGLSTLLLFAIPLIVTHNYTARVAILASYNVTSKNPLTFGGLVLIFGIVSFACSYLISTIFGEIRFISLILNFAVSLAINLVLLTSVAIAHLEVFKSGQPTNT